MHAPKVQKADGTWVSPVRNAPSIPHNNPVIGNGIAFYRFGSKPQPDLRERIELVGEELTDYGIIAPWIPSIWYRHKDADVRQTPQRSGVTGEDHYIDLITKAACERGAHVVVETDKFGERDFAKTSRVQHYRLKEGMALNIKPDAPQSDASRRKGRLLALGREFAFDGRLVRLYGTDEIAPGCENLVASIGIAVDVHMDDALEAANPIIKEESASWYNRQSYLAAAREKARTIDSTIAIERSYEEGYTRFCFSSQGGSYIDYRLTGIVDFYR